MMIYFLKVCLISGVLFTIYQLFLTKRSSFQFNRFFLLFTLIISIVLPLASFEIKPILDGNSFLTNAPQLISTISSTTEELTSTYILAEATEDVPAILVYSYAIISFLLLLRLLFSCRFLFSKALKNSDSIDGMRLYYSSDDTPIYSFFNRLYLPLLYQNKEIDPCILKHELIHAKQLHSIDNLVSEFYILFFWFNPFAWLIKKSIRNNHEYLADQAVAQQTEPTHYMEVILEQVKNINHPMLSSSFSYLSIKNRFNMLQKKKESKFRQSYSIGLTVLLSTCLITLFAFKPSLVYEKIDSKVTLETGVNLYEWPNGSPIHTESITKISSDFGMRIHPIKKHEILHKGVDLIAEEGTNILSTDAGTIVKAVFSKNYGNHIVVQHNAKYKTLYAHLNSMNVQVGDEVSKGQTIGIIGSTGQSLKTHLHYEVREFNKPVNPKIKIED